MKKIVLMGVEVVYDEGTGKVEETKQVNPDARLAWVKEYVDEIVGRGGDIVTVYGCLMPAYGEPAPEIEDLAARMAAPTEKDVPPVLPADDIRRRQGRRRLRPETRIR